MKKLSFLQRLAYSLVALIVLLTIVSEGFIVYALYHDDDEYDATAEITKVVDKNRWIKPWADSLLNAKALHSITMTSSRGENLHAWYMTSPVGSSNTAVLVHGYTSNALAMLHIAHIYHHVMGWNVVMPDLHAHGQSEGSMIQMGWRDRQDVLEWAADAHQRFGSDTIMLHGISMGAATVMCVAGEEVPSYIRAFVEDCGYTSVWDEFSHQLSERFLLPAFPLLYTTSALCKLQLGWSFGEASPEKQLSYSTSPMLFIHGSEDTYVPTEMVYELFASHGGQREMWVAKGSAHAKAYTDHHDKYTRQVLLFWKHVR